jgi:hypothetical protein
MSTFRIAIYGSPFAVACSLTDSSVVLDFLFFFDFLSVLDERFRFFTGAAFTSDSVTAVSETGGSTALVDDFSQFLRLLSI